VRIAVGVILWSAVWTGLGTATRLLANAVSGTHEPLWQGALIGIGMGVGTAAMGVAIKNGWIRGIFRDPTKVQALRDRAARLAEDRAEIVARAKH
jgi:hypothetical protein